MFDENENRVNITRSAPEEVADAKKEKQEEFEIKLGGLYYKVYAFPNSETSLAYRYKVNNTPNILVATLTKFDENGDKIWSVNMSGFASYVSRSQQLNPSDAEFVTMSDGKFLALFGSRLIKFDANCQVEWECDLTYPIKRQILVTEDDDIILLEKFPNAPWNDEYITYHQGAKIVITKVNKAGQIVAKRALGGSGEVSLNRAAYDAKMGLIISGTTKSVDGDFIKADTDEYGSPFVASIDPESFDVRFIFGNTARDKTPYSDLTSEDFTLFDGMIYILFSVSLLR